MQGNLSLERGLAVLRVITAAEEPLGVREIARRSAQSPSSIQRILNTLTEQGFVDQVVETRRYRSGREILNLARKLLDQDELIALARIQLKRLADDLDLNAFLGARRGTKAIYLDALQSSGSLVIRATPGEKMLLHSTALGKALLMDDTDDNVRQLAIDEPFVSKTPRTVTDAEKLIDQLRRARQVGYTTALNENIAGVFSIGAPIRDPSGAIVAALSFAFPRALQPRLSVAELGGRVAQAANKVLRGDEAPARFKENKDVA
ncbi:IclR family transcriptional regulator [Aliirhizobium smilacinae]|uniref:IclR family transcriptional regulator n=1 Tax=Aliirhizobium smilacinae TaxID=1395944 RepID=A0A5C4XAB0_9HYPH|nr:IclR family transcriptional regulator [Rhizobium smilacinae]TNM60338.1 IclR family transcriptional regulator [Rhizobium smilacinae]